MHLAGFMSLWASSQFVISQARLKGTADGIEGLGVYLDGLVSESGSVLPDTGTVLTTSLRDGEVLTCKVRQKKLLLGAMFCCRGSSRYACGGGGMPSRQPPFCVP